MIEGLVITADDPDSPGVAGLVERHLAFAREVTPIEGVHALDAAELMDPSVTLYIARLDEVVVAMGAIRELGARHVELKSMHTLQDVRGRGIGRAMLDHLLAVAAARGARRVSLETGNMDAFAPARALYASVGFVPCRPFADYADSPTSFCMTLALEP